MTITTHYSHQSLSLSLRRTWVDLMIYIVAVSFFSTSTSIKVILSVIKIVTVIVVYTALDLD